jgi:hypothetical protein
MLSGKIVRPDSSVLLAVGNALSFQGSVARLRPPLCTRRDSDVCGLLRW